MNFGTADIITITSSNNFNAKLQHFPPQDVLFCVKLLNVCFKIVEFDFNLFKMTVRHFYCEEKSVYLQHDKPPAFDPTGLSRIKTASTKTTYITETT